MPGLSDQELANYLDELMRATEGGLISWNRANPTTFAWTKREPPGAQLALQEIQRKQTEIVGNARVMKTVLSYILQVFELEQETRTLTLREEIDGSNSEILNEKLRVLFDLVRREKAQKDLEFLRGTLPQHKL
jgi:hypothetical protein